MIIIRCDVCGHEWMVVSGGAIPRAVFNHYYLAHGYQPGDDSYNRFTVRVASQQIPS